MENSNSVVAMRRIRDMLAQNKYLMEFCTEDNFDDAIVTLFEELEAFEDVPLTINSNDLTSTRGLKNLLITLINGTWSLLHKHRNLIKSHETLKEERCRISNDLASLTNQIKRLKEIIQKRDSTLNEVQERERQLKVKVNNLTREVKREKEETAKLRKQIQSKDDQHAHELRRIQQSGNKLRDQLRKSVGTYVPKTRASPESLQVEQEKKIRLYQQTISRLEENNSMMLQEVNDLREELALHANGLELHMESSGLWGEATT